MENEKDDCIIIPEDYLLLNNKPSSSKISSSETMETLWPESFSSGCWQTSLILDLFNELPKSVLSQIMATFVKLPVLCYLSQYFLICQEGCVNILIKYYTEISIYYIN
jgi:hypothetical protein